jgi:ABC-type uncharacterized transport system substrate-binding protein
MRVIGLAVVLTVSLTLAPLKAEPQEAAKVARIGMLRSENRPLDDRIKQNIADVRAGLQDEGYAEGQQYRIDYYSPTREVDVVKLARTLVRDKVDVIHAIAHVAIEAARKATTTIPIVAHDYETDPIAAGFVATLAKPGGNITGMFLDLPEISGKLLELLKTTLPGLRRIGVPLGSPHRKSAGDCRRTGGKDAGPRGQHPRGPGRESRADGPLRCGPQGECTAPVGIARGVC